MLRLADGRWRPLMRGPLWALFIVGSLALASAASVLVDWRHDQLLRRNGVVVDATVDTLDTSTWLLTATFTDPTTGLPVTATSDLWDIETPPSVGDPIRLQVDPANPSVARVAGDHFPLIPLVAILVMMPAAFPATLLVLRVRHARRAERLAAGNGPTFQVLGHLTSGRRHPLGRVHWDLHLHALDDPQARGRAIAVVPLLTSPPAPIAFDPTMPHLIQAKGQLRPYGLVVAAIGDNILWPAAPARTGRQRGERGVRPWRRLNLRRPPAFGI